MLENRLWLWLRDRWPPRPITIATTCLLEIVGKVWIIIKCQWETRPPNDKNSSNIIESSKEDCRQQTVRGQNQESSSQDIRIKEYEKNTPRAVSIVRRDGYSAWWSLGDVGKPDWWVCFYQVSLD